MDIQTPEGLKYEFSNGNSPVSRIQTLGSGVLFDHCVILLPSRTLAVSVF